MDLFSGEKSRIVVLSPKILGVLALPENCEYPLLQADDVSRELHRITANAADTSRLQAVVFLHFSEYADLPPALRIPPLAGRVYQFIVFGTTEQLCLLDDQRIDGLAEFRCTPISTQEFLFIARKSFAILQTIQNQCSLQKRYFDELTDTQKDQQDLINIGRALSAEKDPDSLLRKILHLSKRITGADAGSIYLVESSQNGVKRLRFKYADTFSREIPLEEFTLPMDKKSIAGYVAVTGQVLNLPNAYDLPPDAPYSYNPVFDIQYQYQCRSMLVVPMKNHLDEIIGIIQLINSKESDTCLTQHKNTAFSVTLETPEDFVSHVVPFHPRYNSLLEAVAGQAGIAIENNRMILQIQHQFEEFVKASVFAIESRDPATSGHSLRVARLCTAMARAVDKTDLDPFRDFHFSDNDIKELELAALLHDFGKVYIDVAVFLKAKKLYPGNFDNLCLRLDYLYRYLEVQFASREVELLRMPTAYTEKNGALLQLSHERETTLHRIVEIKTQLMRMNEPTVIDYNPHETLNKLTQEIEALNCLSLEGEKIRILAPQDTLNLSVVRGTLNPVERKEIESHVRHTYHFVSKIPWPPEYRNIPEIALKHHEKLDGSGYPDGLQGKSIPLQARIMAIADIFDALVASDRPYKRAIPLEKVLAILHEEARRGVVDKDLVALFIDQKIYSCTHT